MLPNTSLIHPQIHTVLFLTNLMDQWKLGVPCRIKIFHHVKPPKVLLCGLLCLLSNFLSEPDFVVITCSVICIVSKFSTVTECLSQSGSFWSITLICCSRSVQLINPFLMRSSRQCVFLWWLGKAWSCRLHLFFCLPQIISGPWVIVCLHVANFMSHWSAGEARHQVTGIISLFLYPSWITWSIFRSMN